VQIQEFLSEISSIGYNLTAFAATNLKGTNLPVPACTRPPYTQHTTPVPPSPPPPAPALPKTDPGKGLGLYVSRWGNVVHAWLDQDKDGVLFRDVLLLVTISNLLFCQKWKF